MKAKASVCVVGWGLGGGAIHTSGRPVLQARRAGPFVRGDSRDGLFNGPERLARSATIRDIFFSS